jgi:hypothetical protein
MELLIIAACFFIGLEFPRFAAKPIRYIKNLYSLRRLKPFDCEACVGFWFSIGISLFATDLLSTLLIGTITFNLIKYYLIAKMTEE